MMRALVDYLFFDESFPFANTYHLFLHMHLFEFSPMLIEELTLLVDDFFAVEVPSVSMKGCDSNTDILVAPDS